MAKTKGPLLSLDAHGSIAKTLNYSSKRTGKQARQYNKPTGPASAKQKGQRRLTEFLVAQWQNMSAGDKATWETNAKASGKNLPGYHYFLREAQRDLYTHTGLCMYLPCNEIIGGQVLDLSGKGNHGTLGPDYPSNAPTLITGRTKRFGKAGNFDGTDDVILCGHNASLNITAAISIETWVNVLAHPSTNRSIIEKYKSAGERSWSIASGWANGYRAYCWVGAQEYQTDPTLVLPAGWHELSMTYDGEALKLYLDGVLRRTNSTMSGAMVTDAAQDIRIGYQLWESYIKGYIDEVCIYNRAFSAAEKLARYNFATK